MGVETAPPTTKATNQQREQQPNGEQPNEEQTRPMARRWVVPPQTRAAKPKRRRWNGARVFAKKTPPANQETQGAAPPTPTPTPNAQSTSATQSQDKTTVPHLIASTEGMTKLRELRSEAQALRYAVGKVRDGEAPLDHYAPFLQRTVGEIRKIVDELEGDDALRDIKNALELINTCSVVHPPPPDTSAKPSNPMSSANGATNATATQSASSPSDDTQRISQELKLIDEQSRKMIAKAGYLTIPARLNDWLKTLQAGDAVPFHALFKDEVLDQQDRQDILDLLALVPDSFILDRAPPMKSDHSDQKGTSPPVANDGKTKSEPPPKKLGVYIDATNGMVHCYDRDKAARYAQLWRIGWVWLGITVLLLLANLMQHVQLPVLAQTLASTQYLPIISLSVPALVVQQALTQAVPLFSAVNWSLVLGWLGVSAGLLVHVLVTMQKRFRMPNATFPSLKRLAVIVASKETQILMQVLVAAFGFLAFVFMFGLPQPSTDGAAVAREVSRFLFSAFLVGYSLDSFVELFVANVDQRASALHADVTKRVASSS